METEDARALLALTDAVLGNDPGRESFSTRSELIDRARAAAAPRPRLAASPNSAMP